MGFKIWFRLWRRSLYKILTCDRKRKRTQAQREKERAKRIRSKHSSPNYYKMKKRELKRRRRGSVSDRRLLEGLIGLALTTVAIVLLPLGFFDWAKKSSLLRGSKRKRMHVYRAREGERYKNGGTATASRGDHTKGAVSVKAPAVEDKTPHGTGGKAFTKEPRKEEHNSEPTRVSAEIFAGKSFTERAPRAAAEISFKTPVVSEVREEKSSQGTASVSLGESEGVPRSKPKNERDQYIKKRFTVKAPEGADLKAMPRLSAATYLEVEFDGTFPDDKEAVRVVYGGVTLGYVEKQDRLAIVTCLKLKRRLYGVVADPCRDGMGVEFEAWIERG